MTRPSPDALRDWVAPSRCALVVVDMQADFALADGALGRAGVDLAAVPAALRAAERLVEAARAASVPVVFVGLQTRAETDSPVWAERGRRLGEGEAGALCREGDAGARFVGPIPMTGDLLIAKTRYSTPGWGSSPRPRTTTSTPSRTSHS